MSDRYEAIVDSEVCMGTGSCEAADPEHFTLNEAGLARWVPGDTPQGRDELLSIARLCPNAAIQVRDEHGARVD